jgi:hypothetical protein
MSFLYRSFRAFDSFFQDGPVVLHGITDAGCSGGVFTPVPVFDNHVSLIPGAVANIFNEYYTGTEHKCVWFANWLDVAVVVLIVMLSIGLLYTSLRLAAFVIAYSVSPIGNGFVSLWFSVCKLWSPAVLDNAVYRNQFAKTPSLKASTPKSHSHPIAARIRNASTYMMDHYCALVGRKAYYPQMSKTDERKGRRGARYYHWVKDLNIGFSQYDPEPDEVLCFTDVDMYLDMPRLMSSRPQMMLVSTFQPTKVAANGVNNYAFTFGIHNEVEFTVSGGASFKHPVWNYGTDVVLASSSSWWGLLHTVISYNVERRFLDEHHQLLFLVPSACIVSPIIPIHWWVSGHVLKRLVVVQGDALVMNVMTPEGLRRSVGRVGLYTTANLTAEEDDTIRVQSLISKVDITPASVRSALPEADVSMASVLTVHHRTVKPGTVDTVYPKSESVFNYQFNPGEYDADAKNSLTPFMNPLMLGAYAPTKCLANDLASVQGRIIDVRPAEPPTVDAFRLQTQAEFLSMLVPEDIAGTLSPDDVETVLLKQNRPQQKAINRIAELGVGPSRTDVVQTFPKPEAYSGVKDGRIITTIPGQTKLGYSRFVSAFSRGVMRKTKWYAFGKTPAEISERVGEIAQFACTIAAADLRRMDGCVSQVSRDVEQQAMLRAFHKRYHVELMDYMSKQDHRQAVTPFGVWYETLLARLSGSSETADFNSLTSAEGHYHAYRLMGYTPRQAWEMLGIFGGDDGASADIDPKKLELSFSQVGQTATVEMFKRGDTGVNFLARYYGPDLWTGDINSICDIPRQLSKLHTTVGMARNVLPLDKLIAKALNYCLTDFNTPVIGKVCSAVMSLVSSDRSDYPMLRDSVLKEKPELRGALNWWSQYDISVQWPNNVGDWAQDMLRAWIPTVDLPRLDRWLTTLTHFTVLRPPLIVEPPVIVVTVPAVVNGEVHMPIGPAAPIQVDAAKAPAGPAPGAWRAKVCNDFRTAAGCNRKKCKFTHVPK